MEKNIEQMTRDLQSDANLMKEFMDAKFADNDYDGVADFAVKHGYSVTADDIRSIRDKELSPEELEKIAGGTDFSNMTADDIMKMLQDGSSDATLTSAQIGAIIFCIIFGGVLSLTY